MAPVQNFGIVRVGIQIFWKIVKIALFHLTFLEERWELSKKWPRKKCLVELRNLSKIYRNFHTDKFCFWKNCRKISKKFRDIDFDALILEIYRVTASGQNFKICSSVWSSSFLKNHKNCLISIDDSKRTVGIIEVASGGRNLQENVFHSISKIVENEPKFS